MSEQRAQVELTLRLGEYRDQVRTVVVPINERLARELTEPMELSDEPFSLFLASPGMYGGKGNAVAMRQRSFKMRREVSKDIAAAIVSELEKLFGASDKVNGYGRADWSERDQRQADYVRRKP